MPIYSKQKKHILFIHIPKSGGSSISKMFKDKRWEESYIIRGKSLDEIKYIKCSSQHFHNEIIREIFNLNEFDKIFTLVRDPFERLKSEYYWQLKQNIISNIKPDDWFKEVLVEYKNNKFIYDNHIRPQNEFIFKQVKIFKIEEGIKSVYEYIFEQKPFIFFNETKLKKSKRNNLIEDQFSKIKGKIKDFYAKDYDLFNY